MTYRGLFTNSPVLNFSVMREWNIFAKIHWDCSLAMPALYQGTGGTVRRNRKSLHGGGAAGKKKRSVAAELIKDKFRTQQEVLHADSEEVEIPVYLRPANLPLCRSWEPKRQICRFVPQTDDE
jgi:hypothetical protein